jgi:hypothetical protein
MRAVAGDAPGVLSRQPPCFQKASIHSLPLSPAFLNKNLSLKNSLCTMHELRIFREHGGVHGDDGDGEPSEMEPRMLFG